jgi:hypothetical protein
MCVFLASKVTGALIKLHNEALHNLYYSLILFDDKTKEDELGRVCSAHGRDEKFVQNFGWKA